jgi:hypothetical protein
MKELKSVAGVRCMSTKGVSIRYGTPDWAGLKAAVEEEEGGAQFLMLGAVTATKTRKRTVIQAAALVVQVDGNDGEIADTGKIGWQNIIDGAPNEEKAGMR